MIKLGSRCRIQRPETVHTDSESFTGRVPTEYTYHPHLYIPEVSDVINASRGGVPVAGAESDLPVRHARCAGLRSKGRAEKSEICRGVRVVHGLSEKPYETRRKRLPTSQLLCQLSVSGQRNLSQCTGRGTASAPPRTGGLARPTTSVVTSKQPSRVPASTSTRNAPGNGCQLSSVNVSSTKRRLL